MENHEKAFSFYSNYSEKPLKDLNKEASIICFFFLNIFEQHYKVPKAIKYYQSSPSMDNLWKNKNM